MQTGFSPPCWRAAALPHKIAATPTMTRTSGPSTPSTCPSGLPRCPWSADAGVAVQVGLDSTTRRDNHCHRVAERPDGAGGRDERLLAARDGELVPTFAVGSGGGDGFARCVLGVDLGVAGSRRARLEGVIINGTVHPAIRTHLPRIGRWMVLRPTPRSVVPECRCPDPHRADPDSRQTLVTMEIQPAFTGNSSARYRPRFSDTANSANSGYPERTRTFAGQSAPIRSVRCRKGRSRQSSGASSVLPSTPPSASSSVWSIQAEPAPGSPGEA